MKKILAVLAVLLATLAVPAWATCSATFTVGQGSGSSGSSENLILTNNEAVRGIQVDITDGTAVLDATQCDSPISGFTCAMADFASYVRVLIFSLSGAEIPAGTNVNVGRVLYSVDSGTPSQYICLDPTGLLVSDHNNNSCPATGVSGEFQVIGSGPPPQHHATCPADVEP